MKTTLITAFAALLASACVAQSPAAQEMPVAETSPELTIERLYASPGLSGPSPRSVKYSPDGKRVTFLKAREDDAARFDLWQFDVATGEPSMLVDSTLLEPEEVELSEEEKALRERKRIAGSRGIVSYDWGTADTILVPIGGDLWLVTLGEAGPETRQLTETDAFEYDARVSPDGFMVSFVRDGAVYAIDLASGEEQRLTPLAEPDKAISYGVAEFVAQEEMRRYTGYWWSPDARYLAYARVDESTVDIIPRFDIAAEEVTVINQRYPRAGRPNAVVDLFVRDMETGEVVEITWRREEWGPATDQYLARVGWNGNRLTMQPVNRDQTVMDYRVATPGGNWTTSSFQAEQQPAFINVEEHYRYDPDAGASILTSEQSGYRHVIVRRDPSADYVGLTVGDWAVSDLLTTSDGTVFFTGHKDTPLERHLYSVPLSGGEPTRITPLGSSWSI
ncbi:MAG: DPP IV N-terminal domain-containing protein, partial [Pseudomonadota bacterium]